jgi:hypothetical protein
MLYGLARLKVTNYLFVIRGLIWFVVIVVVFYSSIDSVKFQNIVAFAKKWQLSRSRPRSSFSSFLPNKNSLKCLFYLFFEKRGRLFSN